MQAWRRASLSLLSRYNSAATFREAGGVHSLSLASNASWVSSSPRYGHVQFVECIPQRNFRSTLPSLGVMENMRSAYDTAMQGSESKREAKVFAAQMKYLTADRRVDGDVFLELVEDMKVASGLGGMKEHLPWVQNNPALGEFKRQEEILRALTPAERVNVFALGIGALKRVAKQTGMELHAVESLLGQIKSLAAIQKWMRNRIKGGDKLPESAQEMQNMLMKPESGISKKSPRGLRQNPGIKGGTTRRRKMM